MERREEDDGSAGADQAADMLQQEQEQIHEAEGNKHGTGLGQGNEPTTGGPGVGF